MNRLKKQLTTRSPLSFSLIALFAFVMTYVIYQSFAATGPATLYTSPGGSQSVTNGNTFTVDVRISTGSNVPVTGASVYLTYPTDKLSVQGAVNYNGTPYNTQLFQSDSGGVLRMDRLANPMIAGGDQFFAKVTFKANATGAAAIGFSNSSVVTSGEDDSNILSTRNGVTYTISAPAPPPSNPPPSNPPPSNPPPGSSGGGGSSSPPPSGSGGSTSGSSPGGNATTTTVNPDTGQPVALTPEEGSMIHDEQADGEAATGVPVSAADTVAKLVDDKKGFNPLLIGIPAVVFGGLGLAVLFSRFIYPRLHEMYMLKKPVAPPSNEQATVLPNQLVNNNSPKPGETFTPGVAQASSTTPAAASNPAVIKPATGKVVAAKH